MKSGDLVLCVTDISRGCFAWNQGLRNKKVFTVERTSKMLGQPAVKLKGIKNRFFAYRFKVIRNTKMAKLLYSR